MHLTLNHPNIVNLYHIYSEEGYVQLIMDYAGDSLFTLRKNNKLSTLDNEHLTISILKQLI
jgi:serine/threonine protein kinase